MKLGARMIKTGIAVALSLYIADFLQLDPPLYAALAAVLAIQPSIYRSWQHVLEQLQANLIGALLAVLFTTFLGNDHFVVGLVVILVIAINLQLKLEKSIPLSIVTVIAIMESTTGNFFLFASERFVLILIGIGASVIVNVLFLPPRYEDKLYSSIRETNAEVITYLRTVTFHEFKDKQFREETKRLEDELTKIEQLYLLYKEERSYFRKVRYSKIRKLVLFRKMILTTQKALALLKILAHHEYQQLPQDMLLALQKEIEVLSHYHEKILLKYEGKLKIQHPHLKPDEVIQGREDLVKRFMDNAAEHQIKNQEEWYQLFPLFGSIMNYLDNLERLEKLVEGYHSFHEVNIAPNEKNGH